LLKSYKTTGFSIVGSLTLAKMLGPFALANPAMYVIGGFAMSIGGILGLSYGKVDKV
tara:strand:+ start:497 stop:667 length:171 start_codon:yes stop_codon:yes gene_type:complete